MARHLRLVADPTGSPDSSSYTVLNDTVLWGNSSTIVIYPQTTVVSSRCDFTIPMTASTSLSGTASGFNLPDRKIVAQAVLEKSYFRKFDKRPFPKRIKK